MSAGPLAGLAVLTVGHSSHPLERFLRLLALHRVERLVDVRRFPGSRRHPWFGGDALREALAARGVAYRHAPELGGRRRARRDSPSTGWREEAFRAYADHTATPAFQAELARVVADARAERSALLCAEADPRRCHRRILADVLASRGAEVLHLLADGSLARHALDPRARPTPEGGLVYPGERGLFAGE